MSSSLGFSELVLLAERCDRYAPRPNDIDKPFALFFEWTGVKSEFNPEKFPIIHAIERCGLEKGVGIYGVTLREVVLEKLKGEICSKCFTDEVNSRYNIFSHIKALEGNKKALKKYTGFKVESKSVIDIFNLLVAIEIRVNSLEDGVSISSKLITDSNIKLAKKFKDLRTKCEDELKRRKKESVHLLYLWMKHHKPNQRGWSERINKEFISKEGGEVLVAVDRSLDIVRAERHLLESGCVNEEICFLSIEALLIECFKYTDRVDDNFILLKCPLIVGEWMRRFGSGVEVDPSSKYGAVSLHRPYEDNVIETACTLWGEGSSCYRYFADALEAARILENKAKSS